MESLLVGDEPCTFTKVGDALSSSASAGTLWTKLLDVARCLEIPSDSLVSLDRRLAMKTTTYAGGLYEILEEWRAQKAEMAKLDTLIKALEKNKLNDSADALRTHFKDIGDAFVTEKLKSWKSWKDIPEYLKPWLTCKSVLFQGKQVKLEELMQQDASRVDDKILEKFAKGEIPCIVNNTVPEKLDYYVNRTVTGRSKLKMDVLQHESKDVFVIEGMEKHQLSSHVSDTYVSGNQLKKLTARFILLEHKPDYQKISKIATEPVHWIKYDNGTFQLVESSGSVKNLQMYVDESQDSFLEDELASSKSKVSIIADSPGMGKTSLLANIANCMPEKDTLTRFIVLKEFVEALEKRSINVESIMQVIAEQSSEYEFGRKYVEYALKNSPCLLLFDGFDEVLSYQIESAKKILQIATTLPLARIFVATRPHFRNELEIALHVLGHTIQPFEESNQIMFLIKYWTMKGAIPNDSLTKFTESCVRQLSSNMTDSERDIAGIPLQCRLLAEAYEEDAVRCSEMENASQEFTSLLIHSVFGMYETHMKMRFQKICKQDSIVNWLLSFVIETNQYEIIKHAHLYYALEMLFPDQADQFKYLNTHKIPINELCGLGILEATYSEDIRFVHRTFAEFLVAQFVHENKIYSASHQQFVCSTIFQTTRHDVYLRLPLWIIQDIESFKFTLPVICYFLNGFAKKEIPNNFIIEQYHEQMLPFYMASAYHDYECLPFTMGHYVHHTAIIPSITNLLLITARYSGVELMKIFCSNIDISNMPFLNFKESEKLDAFKLTPLHVAVHRGLYSLVEYLVQKFESKLNELRGLIHFCVYDSLDDGKAIVEDKNQIIKLLNAKSNHCIDEQLLDQRTPLLQYKVHLELLECLIQEGADVNVIDEDGNTVLHKISENEITGESYNRVVEALNKTDFQHFNKPNWKQETPFRLAIENMDLLPATLEIFLSKGADLNVGDYKGDSVLFCAIRGGRSVELISELIHCGADWKHRNKFGENALHFCAKVGKLNTLKYFSETHKMNVSAQDKNRNTPLHHAVLKRSTEHESVQQFLIKLGANVNVENATKKTPFVREFEPGYTLSLSIIQLMEEHGLNITPKIASTALKSAFLRFDDYRLFSSEPDAELLEYLMEKGGKVDFEFTRNFWKWEKVQNFMPIIIQDTTVTPKFLNKARTVGVLTEQECMGLEKIVESSRSKRFYEIVQEKQSSFERVFVVLTDNQQKNVLHHLEKCLRAARAKLRSSLFVTPHPRLNELIFSNTTQSQVMVLVTSNTELSVRRIRETFYKNIAVVEEKDVVNMKMQDKLVVLKCELVTNELFSKLRRFKGSFICICSCVGGDIEGCEIIIDDYTWDHISSFYIDQLWFTIQGQLYNVAELFASPDIIGKLDKLENVVVTFNTEKYIRICTANDCIKSYQVKKYYYYKYDVVECNLGHATRHNDIAPFGKKPLDYLILKQTRQFQKVLDGVRTNVHLIKQNEDGYKSIRSNVSDENMRYSNESTKLCDDFPFCSCNASQEVIFKFSIQFVDYKTVTCEININEFLPKARRALEIQDRIDLFELRKLLEHVQSQSTETDNQLETMKLESNPYDNQIVTKCRELVNYLKSQNHDVTMKKLAVSTLFLHLVPNTNNDELDKYVKIGLLEWKESYLVFKHEGLAWYFIAELLAEPKKVDFITFDPLTNEIFLNCFETKTYQAPGCYLSIPSFRFTNKTVFKFLDSTAIKHSDAVSKLLAKYITTETASKYIHACVNDNLLNLLKIVAGCELHGNLLDSLNLVVLAVAFAEVSLSEWVAQKYENGNNQLVAHIQLELMYPADKLSKFISILYVAVMIGDPSVLQYLIEKHFKNPEIFNYGDKKVEFTRLLCYKAADANTRDSEDFTALHRAVRRKSLPPRTMEIIRMLIENGADPDVVDEDGLTVLHLASQFFSPELTHEVVSYVGSTGKFNFNIRDPYYHTPLHVAILNHGDKQVEFIRLLINKGADVNANFYEESTPLHLAVTQRPLPPRMMEIIRLLIDNGADPDAVDKDGQTFLHLAPYFFTPELYHELIVYFDSTGRNDALKAVASHNFTHLYCAVHNFEPLLATLEIFKSNGIDFNGLDNDGDSVVFIAIGGGRNAEFLNILFTFGADWTISNKKRQENALHVAAYFGNLSALKLFISLECEVNSRNINGHTPLHNAFLGKRYGQDSKTSHEIVVELLKHGADVNAKDNEGNLPIDLAKKRFKSGFVEKRTMHLLQESTSTK